jgi:hypothetical protein
MTNELRIKHQLKLLQGYLSGIGIRGRSLALYGDGKQRYCELGSWRYDQGKTLGVFVYVSPYLSAKISFWAGFGSANKLAGGQLERLHEKFAGAPHLKAQHWHKEIKLNAAMRKRLAQAKNVALEQYDDIGHPAHVYGQRVRASGNRIKEGATPLHRESMQPVA